MRAGGGRRGGPWAGAAAARCGEVRAPRRRGPARPGSRSPLSSLSRSADRPRRLSPNLSTPLLRSQRTPRPPPPNFFCRHRYAFWDFFPSLLLKPQRALDSHVTFQREGKGGGGVELEPPLSLLCPSATSSLSPKENILAWARRSWWGTEPETDHSLIDKEIPAQTEPRCTTSLRQAHFAP